MSANKTTAIAYISAIKAMVNVFNIGNAKRPSGNSVTDNNTAAIF